MLVRRLDQAFYISSTSKHHKHQTSFPHLERAIEIPPFSDSARCPVVSQPLLPPVTPKSWAVLMKRKKKVEKEERNIVMRAENNRTQWLHLRLKPEEYSSIQEKFKKTTCRKLSEYARKVLLDKPLTVKFRNQSLDNFMEEIVRLRKDLNAIGNNFNQAVKRLHSLNQMAEFRIWLIAWSNTRDRIDNGIKEIKSRINNLPKEWLR